MPLFTILHIHEIRFAGESESCEKAVQLLENIQQYLANLATDISFIKNQNDQIMARQEQFDAQLGRLNEATNEIAKDLQQLRSEIATGTVSEESMGKLGKTIDTLFELGKDPSDPVPTTTSTTQAEETTTTTTASGEETTTTTTVAGEETTTSTTTEFV